MKVASNIKCIGCGFETKTIFKKPGMLTPSIGKLQCGGCDSEFAFRASRVDGKGQVNISLKPLKITEKLKHILELRKEQGIKS